jgi:hypothetical protein
MKLRAVAMAACLVGTGTYARAYDYVDSQGYRHWCQLSCERKGIHVPKPDEVKSGEVKSGEVKSGEVKPRAVRTARRNEMASRARKARAGEYEFVQTERNREPGFPTVTHSRQRLLHATGMGETLG